LPPVRVLYCSNRRELETQADRLRDRAAAVRAEPGCLEFDTFRDVEHPENFAQLELWESPQDFDAHWQRSKPAGMLCDVDDLIAPHHRGRPEYPRRDGNNGAEFYPHATFAMTNATFVAKDPAARIESLRWPSRSGVRIVIQSSTDASDDAAFFPYSAETRAQKGCLEFAFYRSLEFPENNLHLELWQGPPVVYDEHFYLRTLHRLYGMGLPRPPTTPRERRYGSDGFEFYQHCFFTLTGDVWQPEDPAERLSTVRWF
jgi:quinol monooxygenase YgiN